MEHAPSSSFVQVFPFVWVRMLANDRKWSENAVDLPQQKSAINLVYFLAPDHFQQASANTV